MPTGADPSPTGPGRSTAALGSGAVWVLIVIGTDRRGQPLFGARVVTAPGGERLGRERPRTETAEYFVRLAGAAPAIRETLVQPASNGARCRLRDLAWTGHVVRLCVVHGGGHTIRFPGAASRRFWAPARSVSTPWRQPWVFFSESDPSDSQGTR